ncbi:MAG: MFS transporter [Dehalococcoidia bacterium]|nr:MFS transporter [Dehalococcoidia bacterium]
MTFREDTLPIEAPEAGPSFRGALANRDFLLLFIGQVTAGIGNGAIQLALPWLVLQLTGSAFQLGFAYFFQFLPMLLFGVLGGVLVDRWDRRLTIVVVDVIRGVAFLSVGAIYYLGALTVEHIYAVIFLESTLANFFNPARAALMPNLVSPESLRPANSLMEITRHIGFLIAPPAGGVLVAILGPAALFLIDGVAFLISSITVFLIRWRPPIREPVVRLAQGWRASADNVAKQTLDGFRTIGRSRLLQVALILGLSLNLIVAPIQVLMPLFVLEVKDSGPSYFALLVGGLLLGLISGSLASPGVARRLGLGRMAIGAVFLLGVIICIAPWPPTPWPPVIAMVIAGAAIGSLNVAQTTMLQSSTTDEERGRVSATYFTATLGVRPFSFLVMGALASAIDIRFLFVALGVMALTLGGFLYRLPEVREHH